MSIKIIAAGRGIPKKRVSNNGLAEFIDTSDEWITTRTGIKNRHVCTDETLTDLSAAAAAQALGNAGLAAENIDLIICSTIGADYQTPSLACCVAERIGALCPAFDVNAACTGFIYALEIASGLLGGDKYKNILIICAEAMSAKVDWHDRSTCVLFGDGAGACIVTSGNALKYIHISSTPDSKVLNMPLGTGNSPFVTNKRENGFMYMNGQEVFKFAVNTVETGVAQAAKALGILPEQIDMFILHQANKRIIDYARTKLRQPEEKFPVNINEYGNISSATIPILLSELLEENKIKPGDKVFMSAFGAGLTAGCCVMVWE